MFIMVEFISKEENILNNIGIKKIDIFVQYSYLY
jgi:hypothetical protein